MKKPAMSIADEVRKEHPKCTCGDCNVPRCQGCFEDYPCVTIRLADSHDSLLAACEAVHPAVASALDWLGLMKGLDSMVDAPMLSQCIDNLYEATKHIDAATARAKGETQ